MFDWVKTLFRTAPPSGETAKERLRLVLLSDHLSLAPDVVDSLKRDLIEVISRYVEIDVAHADVSFEHRDREIAMLASIPITAVRDRQVPQAPPPPEPKAEPPVESEPVLALQAAPEKQPVRSANGAAPRRRRRKKAAAAKAAAAQRGAQPQLGQQPASATP